MDATNKAVTECYCDACNRNHCAVLSDCDSVCGNSHAVESESFEESYDRPAMCAVTVEGINSFTGRF